MKLLVVICGLDCEKSDVYIATKKAPIYVKARPSRAGRNRVPEAGIEELNVAEMG